MKISHLVRTLEVLNSANPKTQYVVDELVLQCCKKFSANLVHGGEMTREEASLNGEAHAESINNDGLENQVKFLCHDGNMTAEQVLSEVNKSLD